MTHLFSILFQMIIFPIITTLFFLFTPYEAQPTKELKVRKFQDNKIVPSGFLTAVREVVAALYIISSFFLFNA